MKTAIWILFGLSMALAVGIIINFIVSEYRRMKWERMYNDSSFNVFYGYVRDVIQRSEVTDEAYDHILELMAGLAVMKGADHEKVSTLACNLIGKFQKIVAKRRDEFIQK